MAIDSDAKNSQESAFKQTTEASDGVETVFDKFALASFAVSNGNSVAFPVHKIQQDGANRLIERERPYRDGAKLDDTGSKARRWTMECVFHNSITEPGLDVFNKGINLYPDSLNDLLIIFDFHETGDLMVPTIGMVRAKAEDYSRVEDVNLVDGATLSLVFVEDNEDTVDFRSITSPTINAQGNRLALKTEFDAQSAGIDSFNLNSLEEAASSLEQAANAPGDAVDDVRKQANRVRHNAERVESAFSQAGQEGRDLLLDPTSTDVGRALIELVDVSARATNDPRRGRPRIVSVITTVDTSMLEISSVARQRYSDLLAINTAIPNALLIPRGSVVKIFANAQTS